MKLNVRKMVLASLFASLIALCAWISIPIPPVAFTLQTFGVLMALGVLGGGGHCPGQGRASSRCTGQAALTVDLPLPAPSHPPCPSLPCPPLSTLSPWSALLLSPLPKTLTYSLMAVYGGKTGSHESLCNLN